jgi:hypothetical protein
MVLDAFGLYTNDTPYEQKCTIGEPKCCDVDPAKGKALSDCPDKGNICPFIFVPQEIKVTGKNISIKFE